MLVGGPTKELFIKSWNASIPQTGVEYADFNLTEEPNNVTTAGYAINKPDALYLPTDNRPIKQIIANKVYNNESNYWLASLSSNVTYNVCLVDYKGFVNRSNFNSKTVGVRPIVSIPITDIDFDAEGNVIID